MYPMKSLARFEGFTEATHLAFACYVEGISQSGFSGLSMAERLAFAEGNAGLSPDELTKAVHFLARYHHTRVKQLEACRDSHGHA